MEFISTINLSFLAKNRNNRIIYSFIRCIARILHSSKVFRALATKLASPYWVINMVHVFTIFGHESLSISSISIQNSLTFYVFVSANCRRIQYLVLVHYKIRLNPIGIIYTWYQSARNQVIREEIEFVLKRYIVFADSFFETKNRSRCISMA